MPRTASRIASPLQTRSRLTTFSGSKPPAVASLAGRDVRLANASPIPLALSEREWTRFTIGEFIDSGALKYVQFDSTRHAGFTESPRIAHLAEQKGVLIAPHTAPHIHGHLVSAFGEAAFGAASHGNHDRHPLQEHLYKNAAEVRDGLVHLNDDPGFGVEIDWTYVEKVRSRSVKRFQRSIGDQVT